MNTEKFAVAQVARGTQQINNLLRQGWVIIAASFQSEDVNPNSNPAARRLIQYVPYALMGLPKGDTAESIPAGAASVPTTAEMQLAEAQGASRVEDATKEEVTQEPVKEADPARSAQPDPDKVRPVASRPDRTQRFLADQPDLSRSSEEVIGVRR